MLHPIFLALLRRPELAADHLLAYADLLRLQAQVLRAALVQRALAWLVAGVFAILCLVFTGLALMLSLLLERYHPVLVCLPAGLALVALGAALLAGRRLPGPVWATLRAQLELDVAALHALRSKP